MKLKDIAIDKKKTLDDVLNYINNINFNDYIYSDGNELLYNDTDFYVEDISISINIGGVENCKNKIKNILLSYWDKLIDNIPVQKHDKGLIIVIGPVIKGKDNGEWQLCVEDFDNGNFYMNVSTKILEKLNK